MRPVWSASQETSDVEFSLRAMQGVNTQGALRVFLTAISDAGRDFYLNTQQLLDLFYPTLFAITVAIALVHLIPRYWGWTLAALAIAAGVFDHLENSAVAVMLRVETDALTEAMVLTANNWSWAKSISTTIVLVVLLAVLCIKVIAWLKTRKAQAGLSHSTD